MTWVPRQTLNVHTCPPPNSDPSRDEKKQAPPTKHHGSHVRGLAFHPRDVACLLHPNPLWSLHLPFSWASRELPVLSSRFRPSGLFPFDMNSWAFAANDAKELNKPGASLLAGPLLPSHSPLHCPPAPHPWLKLGVPGATPANSPLRYRVAPAPADSCPATATCPAVLCCSVLPQDPQPKDGLACEQHPRLLQRRVPKLTSLWRN